MYRITDVISFDRIDGKPFIQPLITQTRYPKNVTATLCTHRIYHRLKILFQFIEVSLRTGSVSTIGTKYINRFVGQFKHNVGMILQFRMLGYVCPYFNEILIILISYSYFFRTYSGRTHDYIKSFRDSIFRHRNKYPIKIVFKPIEIEC